MRFYKFGFWLTFFASLVLFFSPFTVEGGRGLGLDKLVHALLFAALIFFALNNFPRRKLATFIFIFLYAFASEFIQGTLLSARNFEWYDVVADGVGVVLGLIILSFPPRI